MLSHKRHNFCIELRQLFVLKHRNYSILKTEERKGKLVEKRGRKATGLKLKSHGSRVAEHLQVSPCSKHKKYCSRLFRYPFLHKLSTEKKRGTCHVRKYIQIVISNDSPCNLVEGRPPLCSDPKRQRFSLRFHNHQDIPAKANTTLCLHIYHFCHHLMPETVNICGRRNPGMDRQYRN